jgi:hypothetical protein
MSLDSFIAFLPDTNQWFSAGSMYLVDTRKLSGEENDELLNYPPNEKTQEILNKYGMTLDSCEYHKIMEDAEEVEETMKIDLEEFVNKEVVITLRNGEEYVTTIKKYAAHLYSYCFKHPCGHHFTYTQEGINDINTSMQRAPLDIVKIELKQPQKQMTPLSDATIEKLADALTDDAIKYLELDEEYIETLVSVINRFLTDRMGQMDDTLLSEICLGIFEQISITPDKE